MKTFEAALLAVLLASTASADYLTVYDSPRTVHLGDESIRDWAVPEPQGLESRGAFFLEGQYQRVWADMEVWDVDGETNEIRINDRRAARLCESKSEVWRPCTVVLDPRVLRTGRLNLSIHALYRGERGSVRDDFMVRNLKVMAEYDDVNPKLLPEKTQSAYNVTIGESVNVTITVTNVGGASALNVSVSDVKPQGGFIIRGSTSGSFTPLRPGDIYHYTYALTFQKTGRYASWPGAVEYGLPNGTKRTIQLEPTVVYVRGPKPDLWVEKNITGAIVAGSQIRILLTVVNNGSEDAYNVKLYDILPLNFTIVSGSQRTSYAAIRAGENVTYEYVALPVSEGLYLTAATLTFNDREGNTYERTSPHLSLVVLGAKTAGIGLGNPLMILGALVAIAAVLVIVYDRVRPK